MDLKDILQTLTTFCNTHGIPREKAVVGGGAALVFHGLRERATDLNLWVPSDLFKLLEKRYGLIVDKKRDPAVKIEGQNVYVRIHNPYYSTAETQYNPITASPYPVVFYSIISLIIHKRTSHQYVERPKEKRAQDAKDIEKLEAVYREIYAVKK